MEKRSFNQPSTKTKTCFGPTAAQGGTRLMAQAQAWAWATDTTQHCLQATTTRWRLHSPGRLRCQGIAVWRLRAAVRQAGPGRRCSARSPSRRQSRPPHAPLGACPTPTQHNTLLGKHTAIGAGHDSPREHACYLHPHARTTYRSYLGTAATGCALLQHCRQPAQSAHRAPA